MTTTNWEKVAPGRYALAYLGHTLEVVLNPDFPALDNRRYLAVVDHKPLEPKSWLNGAKTAAIMHVQKVGRISPRIGPEARPIANEEWRNGTHVDLDQSEPQPDQSEPQPDQSEPQPDQSEPQPDQSEPQPDQPSDQAELGRKPAPEPVRVQLSDQAEPGRYDTGRFAITGRITDQDNVRAYAAIKSMVELLREHAEVECSITLPSVLKL